MESGYRVAAMEFGGSPIGHNFRSPVTGDHLSCRLPVASDRTSTALDIAIRTFIYNNNSCAFSYTPLRPKDDEVHDVTTLRSEVYHIVFHKYCYMQKYADRS